MDNTQLVHIHKLLARAHTHTCVSYVGYLSLGCWFDNPRSGEDDALKMRLPISDRQLRAIDCQLSCKDLCRVLTELLFLTNELKRGNAALPRWSNSTQSGYMP